MDPLDRSAADGDRDEVDEAPIDRATWSELRSLGCEGGPDVLREILAMFLDEAVSSLTALRAASIRPDVRAVQDIAHRLKGSAANVGARKMAAICDQLQSVGDARRSTPPVALVEELEGEFQRVREACEQELAARRT